MDRAPEFVEVLIVLAGPAAAVAAGLLYRQGRQVLMLERETFPRFSIGESLLPQSMEYLEQAGMLRAVEEGEFQLKDGAAFGRGEQYTAVRFWRMISSILAGYAWDETNPYVRDTERRLAPLEELCCER